LTFSELRYKTRFFALCPCCSAPLCHRINYQIIDHNI